jgi:hypothetical protein
LEGELMGFLDNIPIASTAGFIGLGLLLLGGFMVLAGLDIIRIEKITVRQGRTTWVVGIVFAAIGLVLLLPEFASSPDATKVESPIENMPATAATSSSEFSGTLTEWAPVEFLVADSSLWRDTTGGVYSAIGSKDAFAWSTGTYQGDLLVSLDLRSPESQSSGCVVVYGDGLGFSYGNLIFCVDWDGYGLEKDTIYHEGENRLAWYPSPVDLKADDYSVTIEITGGVASMLVNGSQVISRSFDRREINQSGRIGLLKKWFDPEVRFSNIRIRIPGDGP